MVSDYEELMGFITVDHGVGCGGLSTWRIK